MALLLSLCTGTGGLDVGVTDALAETSVTGWFSEFDPVVSEWYQGYRDPEAIALGDLKEIDWAKFKDDHPGLKAEDIVITGGYPCQPFSQAGKRLGDQDPRHLWPFIFDAIRHLRPGLVVLENVRGHLNLGFGQVLADLASIGFDAEWSVVKASDVGAPHQRARLFFIAYPSDPVVL